MNARIAPLVLISCAAYGLTVQPARAEPVLAFRQNALGRDPNERIKMIRAAREALSPEAVRLLVVLLGDTHPRVRQEAIQALGGVVEESAVAYVAKALEKSACEEVRAGAAEALGRIDSTASRTALEAALGDRSPKVRACALDALGRMADPSTAALVAARLKDPDPVVRAAAVEALASVDPARAARELPACLADRDVPVRMAAVEGLSRVAPAEAASTIKRALADPAWQVRATAIDRAETIRKPELIPLLIDRIEKEDGRLRGDLLRALRSLTRKEIGLDAEGWRIWWGHHGKDFACPETAKDGPQAPAPLTIATFCSIPLYSRRVAFVLDLSGSMRDTSNGGTEGPRKVDVVKAELHKAIRSFTPETRFNVILLGSDAEGRFDAKKRVWMPRLTPATPAAREHAIQFSAAQIARGYTNLYDAVLVAFQDPDVDTVILLSDGGATKGTFVARGEILDNLLRENRWRKIAIHTVASGARRGADQGLLTELAAQTGGVFVKK